MLESLKYDILVTNMVDDDCGQQWYSSIIPQGIDLNDFEGSWIVRATFKEILSGCRVFYEADPENFQRVIITSGTVFPNQFPDFHTQERRIYDTMYVVDTIDDLRDDDLMATIRLRLQ